MGPRPRPRQQSRSRHQQARRSSASSSQSQSSMSESTQLGTTTNSSAGGFPVPTGHPPGASPYPTQYGASPYPTQYGASPYPTQYGPPASNQGAAENPYAPKSLPTPYGGGLPPLHGPGPRGPPISTPRAPMNTGAAISTGERAQNLIDYHLNYHFVGRRFQIYNMSYPQQQFPQAPPQPQLSSTPSQVQPGVYYAAVSATVSFPQHTGPPRQFAGGVGHPVGFTENERRFAMTGISCMIITAVVICLVIVIIPIVMFFVVFQKVEDT
ncbi:unnamed protein product [Orchesella dallaii]|uniref:Uncharacterized protein n=1 Tax=Orchesella dallaii TaxID=48710 RepID=A0ABP1RYW2_9HEXA